MGLDTYALPCIDGELSAEDLEAFEKAEINLCEGGGGSFRGKVYDMLVLDITEHGLYQECIPPEEVTEMYEELKFCRLKNFPDKEQDIVELRKFFNMKEQNVVLCQHALLGEKMYREELETAIMAIGAVADKYDEEIVNRLARAGSELAAIGRYYSIDGKRIFKKLGNTVRTEST